MSRYENNPRFQKKETRIGRKMHNCILYDDAFLRSGENQYSFPMGSRKTSRRSHVSLAGSVHSVLPCPFSSEHEANFPRKIILTVTPRVF